MKEKKQGVKTVMNRFLSGKILFVLLLASSLFISAGTYAQSSNEYQGADNSGQNPPGRHSRHPGPPTEAIQACDGAGESEACSFTSPRGDEITGTCEYLPDDQFACAPEGGPPGARRSQADAPPPE